MILTVDVVNIIEMFVNFCYSYNLKYNMMRIPYPLDKKIYFYS